MSVQVSYKKQFTLYCIFLLIVLVGIEGIAKSYEFFFGSCYMAKSEAVADINYFKLRQMCLDYRSLAFIEPDIIQLKPNQHFPSINVNDHGFRGPETTIEKPDNTYRIFVVGGSTTMGQGSSSDKTTIPGYLQQKFDNEELDINVEVINAGINGLYSFSEVYHIKKNILKFNPDLIINYGGINDADAWIENPQLKSTEEVEEKYGGFKFKNYPYYRTPFVLFTLFFEEEFKEKAYPQRHNPHDEILTDWKNRWLDICELGTTKQFKTMILVQPSLGTGNKNNYSIEEMKHLPKTEHELRFLQILESMAHELNDMSNTCDFVGDLRYVYDSTNEPLYYDPWHVNDRGNKIVSDKIFELTLPIVLDDTII